MSCNNGGIDIKSLDRGWKGSFHRTDLFRRCVKEEDIFYTLWTGDGYLPAKKSKRFFSKIEKFGFRLVVQEASLHDEMETLVYEHKDLGFIHIFYSLLGTEYDSNKYIQMFVSLNVMKNKAEELNGSEGDEETKRADVPSLKNLTAFLKRNILEDLPKQKERVEYVYTIVQTQNGFDYVRLPKKMYSPFIPGNYNENIIERNDKIIQALGDDDPPGRLFIFAGEPGTGKTYYIRSLVGNVGESIFVNIPPNMVTALSGPNLVQFLYSLRDDVGDTGSIIFVVEDADECLKDREGGGVDTSAISSLLNIGSGLFGESFDIKVIATTNMKHVEMDRAITRKGRLMEYLEFRALSQERAEAAFRRLLGDDEATYGEDRDLTVSGVYHAWKQFRLNDTEVDHFSDTVDKDAGEVGFSV